MSASANAGAISTGAVEDAALLDDLVGLIRRYVWLRPEEADAAALWIVHTHALDAAHFTPYLGITSATSESGKSTLLRVLAELVRNPWSTGGVSPAVLARKIDSEQPTLLLDEVDALLGSGRANAERLRGILNNGFSRRGGTYSVMDGRCVRDFHVFGPKALAGIGKLFDTIVSRSIHIRLRRLGKGESIAELEQWELEEAAAPLRTRADAWAAGNVDSLRRARVALPDDLTSRARDIWKPLTAIADAAGADWSQRARTAALRLSERKRQSADVDETRVLAVIREAFEEAATERLPTLELAKALAAADLIAAVKVTDDQAAGIAVKRAVAPFEVTPAQKIRFGPLSNRQGYYRLQFEDAWGRYL